MSTELCHKNNVLGLQNGHLSIKFYGQSTSMIKGCMYIVFHVLAIPLFMEGNFSPANFFRKFSRLMKVVCMLHGMQKMNFYLINFVKKSIGKGERM